MKIYILFSCGQGMISVTNGNDIIFKFAPAPLHEFLVFIYSTLHKQLAMEMNVVKLT